MPNPDDPPVGDPSANDAPLPQVQAADVAAQPSDTPSTFTGSTPVRSASNQGVTFGDDNDDPIGDDTEERSLEEALDKGEPSSHDYDEKERGTYPQNYIPPRRNR